MQCIRPTPSSFFLLTRLPNPTTSKYDMILLCSRRRVHRLRRRLRRPTARTGCSWGRLFGRKRVNNNKIYKDPEAVFVVTFVASRASPACAVRALGMENQGTDEHPKHSSRLRVYFVSHHQEESIYIYIIYYTVQYISTGFGCTTTDGIYTRTLQCALPFFPACLPV